MVRRSGRSGSRQGDGRSHAVEQGNLSNTKSVGGGVEECRIVWGPGYRLYFGRDGDTLILLLCGGTKHRQQDDIRDARAHWAAYKRLKKEG